MKTITTPSQDKTLSDLFKRYQQVVKEYSYSDWAYGDVPAGRKRAKTMRFMKFYDYATALGFNMITDLPKCMLEHDSFRLAD